MRVLVGAQREDQILAEPLDRPEAPDRVRLPDARDEAVERVRIVVVDVARRPRLVGIDDEGQQLEPAGARDVVLELGVRALVAVRPAAVAMGEQQHEDVAGLDLTTADVRRRRTLGRELLHVHGLESEPMANVDSRRAILRERTRRAADKHPQLPFGARH